MKTVVICSIALLLFAAAAAHSQLSTRGDYPYRSPAASQDPTDAGVRHQKSEMGQTPEEWARHLDDADPEKRLEAVRLLAGSGDPKASRYLIQAVDNPDERVAISAIDALGKLGVKEASDVLAERLSMATTKASARQHILVALGKIRDPGSARRVLDFARAETDPELRAVAIRVMGEIGDDSVRSDVQKLSEAETDPKLKTLMQDAVAKMTMRQGQAHATGELPAQFSHSEANP